MTKLEQVKWEVGLVLDALDAAPLVKDAVADYIDEVYWAGYGESSSTTDKIVNARKHFEEEGD